MTFGQLFLESYLYFENLCVARCTHDWRLRNSLAKEIEGQMSIVTKLPDVLTQSGVPIAVEGLGDMPLLSIPVRHRHVDPVCSGEKRVGHCDLVR